MVLYFYNYYNNIWNNFWNYHTKVLTFSNVEWHIGKVSEDNEGNLCRMILKDAPRGRGRWIEREVRTLSVKKLGCIARYPGSCQPIGGDFQDAYLGYPAGRQPWWCGAVRQSRASLRIVRLDASSLVLCIIRVYHFFLKIYQHVILKIFHLVIVAISLAN